MPQNHPVPLGPGERVGKYEIRQRLGSGGMAVVWHGYDRLLDRHVALKQFAPELVGEQPRELRQRFRQEARLHQKVSQASEHLVDVIEYLEDPRGLFIVMEYVPGRSLEQLLAEDEGPMEERRALGIVAATALALKAVHEGGVLHRDLKPSNILLPQAGGLKVCDFGLATLLADQEALALGTVRYMAPELFGDEPADARADIYSLGLIAYEMLAGRAAFQEAFKSVLRDQRNQAVRWMKWHSNPRAKAPPLNKLNPQVSPTVSELVGRMMEKDPDQRLTSAQEVLDAIRRHAAGTAAHPGAGAGAGASGGSGLMGTGAGGAQTGAGLSAETLADAAPTAVLPRPSRLPWVLAALLLVQLVAGLSWLALNQRTDNLQDQRLHEAREWQEQGILAYQQGRYQEAHDKLSTLAEDWGDDPTLGKVSRAYAALALGRLRLAEGRYDQALEAFDQAEKDGVVQQAALEALQREARNKRAFEQEVAGINQWIEEGQYGAAEQKIGEMRELSRTEEERQRLAELQARIDQAQFSALATRALERAAALEEEDKLAEAIDLLAGEARLRPDPRLDERLAHLRREQRYRQTMSLAREAQAEGDLHAELTALQEAQSIRPEPQGSQRVSRLQALIAYREGQQAQQRGDLDQARRLYTQALDHFNLPEAQAALEAVRIAQQQAALVAHGDSAMFSGDYEAAAQAYEEALALGHDPDIAHLLLQAKVSDRIERGRSLLAQRQLGQARALLEEAAALDGEDPEVQSALNELDRRETYEQRLVEGDTAREEGRFGDAKRAYRAAREVLATPEIEQRLTDTEYEHLVAQARAYMENEAWDSARGFLVSAAQIRDTEEVRELLAEVARHVRPPAFE